MLLQENKGESETGANEPWLVPLAEFLARQPRVEALRVQGAGQSVAVATLGEVDDAALLADLRATLAAIAAQARASSAVPSAAAAHLPPAVQVARHGGTVTLAKPACPTAPRLYRWQDVPWAPATAAASAAVAATRPADAAATESEEEDEEEDWRVLAAQAAICGVLGLAGVWASQQWPAQPVGVVLFALAMVAGGWDAAIDAWARARRGILDVHFLMLAVALGAAAVGAWGEGVLLLFLFSLSGALEHFAEHRTRREISQLFKEIPKTALVLDAVGEEQAVPVEAIGPGQRLRVKPGELFPLDGRLAEGRTAADESALTGEAVPVDKVPGADVFGGTLNLQGSVVVEVTRPARDSALQRVIQLIQAARQSRAPSQRLTDRFGTRYTWLILGLTTLMFFVWWLGFGRPPFFDDAATGQRSAFYLAMTLLVVASPCALVLSIPSAILAAIAWGARRGLLFRGGGAVENLAASTVVCLDKTGTLTTGEMRVERVESFPAGREAEVSALAFGLEQQSTHPIARAIVAHLRTQGVRPAPVEHVENLPGQGLRATWQGADVFLGRRELVQTGPLGAAIAAVPPPPFQFTEVWVVAPTFVGRVLLRDAGRPEAKGVLAALRKFGLRTVMLTGDRRDTAQAVAAELGVDEVRAGLQPADKVAAIRALQVAGERVVMVGDGVNDAPSLATAEVGIAMGARGSDAALEEAQVILMRDKIENVLQALRLSREARAVIQQNLVISLGTVVLMVLASLTGIVPLPLGVLAHEGSTVVVCLNSLRLLFLPPLKL